MNRPEDLTPPTTGNETGWWDDDGYPAPWPDDYPKNWRPETHDLTPEPGKPPF